MVWSSKFNHIKQSSKPRKTVKPWVSPSSSISFGGIPNRIYKSLCHVWLYGRHFFCAVVLPMWTMSSPKGVQNNHMAAPVKVARQQTTPELSRTFRTLPPEPMHQRTDLPPELPSATCLRNLHQLAPELSGTLHNLPESTTAHTGTLRNLPEPSSGTYTSTHRNPPEPSGTFLRNLPPEPAPATRTGTNRSLSGLKTPLAYAVGEKINMAYLDYCVMVPVGSTVPFTNHRPILQVRQFGQLPAQFRDLCQLRLRRLQRTHRDFSAKWMAKQLFWTAYKITAIW